MKLVYNHIGYIEITRFRYIYMTRLKHQILYLKIYQEYAAKIKEGKLKANEKLPSKRKLAEKNNVSLITIEKAYEQLLSEGYIYSIEKKGYYVSQIDIAPNKKVKINQTKELKQSNYKIDFTSTSSGSDIFPFSAWSKTCRKVISNNQEKLLLPCDYKGHETLRKAIAKHLNNYLGMEVSYNQIIISSGSESLYSLLINFLGRNKKYALEDPGHKSIANTYKEYEVDYNYIPLDENGISVDILNKVRPDVVHVSTNHHYPSGITMPIKRRYELLNYAINNDSIIIEDDYDVELRLKGKPISPLYSLNNSHVIYMNTFSITLAPSFRIAYMILPEKLLKEYEIKMKNASCTVPVLDQLILADFIDEGSFERLLNKKKKKYREIREELLKNLNNNSDITIKEADMGLHLLIYYPYQISDKEVEEIALKMGIKIYTLSHFLNKEKDAHTLLIKYTSIDKNNLNESIKQLNKLLEYIKVI